MQNMEPGQLGGEEPHYEETVSGGVTASQFYRGAMWCHAVTLDIDPQ